ncbi:hypothetical protein [Acidobacterium sp. S8]|uniref:hypothetical protein n=1 Tax=Acidobacterium sp. S8 TaxID=1641854 RepID=UPI00131B4224|nr:hypothetical protein [Acidobacterium sp. S8]
MLAASGGRAFGAIPADRGCFSRAVGAYVVLKYASKNSRAAVERYGIEIPGGTRKP